MDMWTKIVNGIACSATLGAGLLGLYLSHKKRIPEYMGIVSCCITCVSIYVWTTHFFEDEFEETGDEKEGNTSCATKENISNDLNISTNEKVSTETPKPVKEWGIARRIFLNQFKEETDKVLENILEMEQFESRENKPKKIERIFIKLSDLALVNQNAPDEVSQLLKKVSDKLGEIKLVEVEDAGISIQTLPLQLEMLDIKIEDTAIDNNEKALTQNLKNIMNELQVGEIPLLIDSVKKE